ncbi:hypothetical protein [Aneurinibacillus aneurinilyticus]|uniref:Uncharacterized protein n=1 Tax=Aneurinibacillus aneurinilyticus ATCC 12856 TaxID=649747 RepID=U1X8H1_ANEAE|nr:hypothetical protein [Aneurinibacillus aneurinilyticus]ERI10828.1 hypothetical protein HMPREF0083_01084 [Aneurinibacillus aneurinilyticus ATCC 12856]MED0705917.1 hypothetical protein [Aneurinibacillus aneurinilyticus]MED0722694.1 hypothetical protein [Aneurinibacillus aneurinilyticus]MED0731386.1 hypothetical protein [Aneurinibacillus aneurinilyticus]MED0740142.1 hypothetical protein [Aneurinibacillus aneurinilyticus]
MARLIKPGQTIPFRLPKDTPEDIIEYLNEMKEKEGSSFNSKVTSLFIEAIYKKKAEKKDVVSFPLPGTLTEEQQRWINNQHTRQALGQWVYQMITQPSKPVDVVTEPSKKKKEHDEETSPPEAFQISDYHSGALDGFFDDDD